jgi:N-acylneuraminate cytidylyltransferase
MQGVSAFFPLRAGSSRVTCKNTKPFHPDGRSLFQLKLDQIVKVRERFLEVVISTNDPEVIDQFPMSLAETNIRIERRPDYLCSSTTKVQDLIDYVPTVTQGDWIFWLHATSPFVDETDYLAAFDLFESEVLAGEMDSVMSVNRLQQFIWNDRERRVINTDRAVNRWPNTQDLEPLYEINHAFYINSRQNYLALGDRIGQHPALHICEGRRKIDIDWQDDFDLARSLLFTDELSSA